MAGFTWAGMQTVLFRPVPRSVKIVQMGWVLDIRRLVCNAGFVLKARIQYGVGMGTHLDGWNGTQMCGQERPGS